MPIGLLSLSCIAARTAAAFPGGVKSFGSYARLQAMATIDKPSGHNGHKAQVSVTPTQASSLGFVYVELHSVLQGAEERVYPVLVSLQ